MGFELDDLCPGKWLSKMGLDFAPCPTFNWSIDFGKLATTDFWMCFIKEAVGTTIMITVANQLTNDLGYAFAWGLSYCMVRMFLSAGLNALCKWHGFLSNSNSLGEFIWPLLAQMVGGFMAFYFALYGESNIGIASGDELKSAAAAPAADAKSMFHHTRFFTQTAELHAVVFYAILVCKASAPKMSSSIWDALRIAAAFMVGGKATVLFPGAAFTNGFSGSAVCSSFALVTMQMFAVFMAFVFIRWFWPINFGEYEESVADKIEEAVEDLKDEMEDLKDDIEDAVDDVKSDIESVVSDLKSDIEDAVEDAVDGIKDKAKGFMSKVKDAFD